MLFHQEIFLQVCLKGKLVYLDSYYRLDIEYYDRPVYNLNEMAHDATIKLIKEVLKKKINLEEVSSR